MLRRFLNSDASSGKVSRHRENIATGSLVRLHTTSICAGLFICSKALVELMQKGLVFSRWSLLCLIDSCNRFHPPMFCCVWSTDRESAAGSIPTSADALLGRRLCGSVDR
jgi:hypothetical protein